MSNRPKIPGPPRTGIPSGLVSKRITEIDITVDLQALALQASYDDDEATPTATPRSGSPATVVTPPGFSTFTMFSDRPRKSSEATIKPVTERPRLRRKAYTAPSGSLQEFPGTKLPFKPQPPRRAISSTTASAFSRSGSRDRRRPSKDQSLTPSSLSQLGLQASRSLVSKKKGKRNSGGRLGLKSKPLVWRLSSPPKAYELPPELKQSFSEKARVKQTLRSKKVESLRVEFPDQHLLLQSGGLPSTPAASIVPTPSTFYKRSGGSVRTKTPPSPARSATSSRSIGSIGSIGHVSSSGAVTLGNGMRSAPLRVVGPPRSASLPKTPGGSATPRSAGPSRTGTLSKRAKHFSLPLSPAAQRVPWRRSIVGENENASRAATPVPRERRPVYIPGSIQLEEKMPVTPRRGSVANLERFDDGTVQRAKRFSDLVALDGIVMYFEALGVAEEASEACLDRFWLQSNKSHHHTSSDTRAKSPRKAASRAPTVPPPPPVPSPPSSSGGIATTFEGIFRTQRTLRDDDDSSSKNTKAPPPPSPGTPGRRKPLLRQLLKSSRKSG